MIEIRGVHRTAIFADTAAMAVLITLLSML